MSKTHPSHDMQPKTDEAKGLLGEECFRCLLCTCHNVIELRDPCGDPKPLPDIPIEISSTSRVIDIREFK